MSFAGLLTHRLAVVTPIQADPANDDEWGQPTESGTATVLVNGLVQPRRARELPDSKGGGAPVTDHVIYLPVMALDASATIRDEPDTGRRFDIVGIRHLAFGSQPHLEVDAILVGPAPSPPLA